MRRGRSKRRSEPLARADSTVVRALSAPRRGRVGRDAVAGARVIATATLPFTGCADSCAVYSALSASSTDRVSSSSTVAARHADRPAYSLAVAVVEVAASAVDSSWASSSAAQAVTVCAVDQLAESNTRGPPPMVVAPASRLPSVTVVVCVGSVEARPANGRDARGLAQHQLRAHRRQRRWQAFHRPIGVMWTCPDADSHTGLVPGERLELSHGCPYQILSLARLPISPPRPCER